MKTGPERAIDELIAELERARERVEAIYSKLGQARDTTLPRIGRTDDSALVVAGYLETFVRVSGFFENDLAQGRWHATLARFATARAPDSQPPPGSRRTHTFTCAGVGTRPGESWARSLSHSSSALHPRRLSREVNPAAARRLPYSVPIP